MMVARQALHHVSGDGAQGGVDAEQEKDGGGEPLRFLADSMLI